MINILPSINACPFCGAAITVPSRDALTHYVYCWNCFASGPKLSTELEAIERWNAFAHEPVLTGLAVMVNPDNSTYLEMVTLPASKIIDQFCLANLSDISTHSRVFIPYDLLVIKLKKHRNKS